MKKISCIFVLLLLFYQNAISQTPQTTSKFVKVVRNSAGRVVPGLDVELWQDGLLAYQLTESASNPGEYYNNSVAHGLYDLYINAILKVGNIYHGAKKITNVIDRFSVTGDTLVVDGYIQADSFIGDGSQLTGIVGSVVDAPDDLSLEYDTNADNVGDFKIVRADTIRVGMKLSSVHNQMNFIIGNANNRALAGWSLTSVSTAGLEPGLQFHTDTTGYSYVVRPYRFTNPNSARYTYMAIDDLNDEAVFGMTETGDPPGTDLWPIVVKIGGTEKIRHNLTASTIIRDTTRVEKLRFQTSGTSGNALIIDSDGNVSASATPLIGDTVEVSVVLDTTASNSGSGNAAEFLRLGIRRALTFWTLGASGSDTLLASFPIPDFIASLDYIVLHGRANASSGNYYMSFSWEFSAHDDAVDNSFTFTNNSAFSVVTPSASGDWIMYRKTLSSSSAGSNRWLDIMLIRVGDNGSDTASGNFDLSTEMTLGFKRVRGY